jgi:hypothetical protein
MMRPTCGQAHTGAVLPAEASHERGAVGKTEREAADRGTSLRSERGRDGRLAEISGWAVLSGGGEVLTSR